MTGRSHRWTSQRTQAKICSWASEWFMARLTHPYPKCHLIKNCASLVYFTPAAPVFLELVGISKLLRYYCPFPHSACILQAYLYPFVQKHTQAQAYLYLYSTLLQGEYIKKLLSYLHCTQASLHSLPPGPPHSACIL